MQIGITFSLNCLVSYADLPIFAPEISSVILLTRFGCKFN